MYLTFYKNVHDKTALSFEEIQLNPYAKLPEKNKDYKIVTITITEEYGQNLYNKRKSLSKEIYEITLNNYKDLYNELDTKKHYRHFEIPKKSDPNKKRPIDAPDDYLKNAQLLFKNYIEEELSVLSHNAAHAYVKNRSTVTAMKKHKDNNSRWFLQIDLKNFFNSINGEFLEKMLLEVYPFKFIPRDIFKSIINVSLLNNELPQGSVLSPTLTNLVMVPIDKAITDELHNYNHHHYVYTRYADDITISCKEKFDPKEIIDVIKSIFNRFEVPFKINNDKTRFGSSAGRNYHLGIIINNQNKLSIGHEKNNKFRAMLFNFCTTGDQWDVKDVQKMLGLISYYKSIEKPYVITTINKYNNKFNMDIMKKAKSMLG